MILTTRTNKLTKALNYKQHIFSYILLLSLLITTTTGYGAPLSHKETNLETSTWLSPDADIYKTKIKVVHYIQNKPHSAFAHYLLSHVYLRILSLNPSNLSYITKATSAAQQALALRPKSDYGYVALADILSLLGQQKKAKELIKQAKSSGIKNSWRIDFIEARILIGSVSIEKSLQSVENALNNKTANKDVIVPYAIAILEDLSLKEKISYLKKWESKYKSTDFTHELAITYSEQQNFKESIRYYNKLLKADPKNTEAIINKSILLLTHLNKPEASYKALSKIEAKAIEPLPNDTQSTYYRYLAKTQLKKNLFKKARENFLKSLLKSQDLTLTTSQIIKDYQRTNKKSDVYDILNNYNVEHPGSAFMHAVLGEFLSEELSRHNDALDALSSAIIIDPTKDEYFNAMGLIYYRTNKLDLALRLFNEAAILNPESATAIYNKACILSKLGETTKALSALNNAISLDPGYQAIAQQDNDFASIRTNKNFIKLTTQEYTLSH